MPFTNSIYLLLDSLFFSTVYYEETHEVLLFLVLIIINRGAGKWHVFGTFAVETYLYSFINLIQVRIMLSFT